MSDNIDTVQDLKNRLGYLIPDAKIMIGVTDPSRDGKIVKLKSINDICGVYKKDSETHIILLTEGDTVIDNTFIDPEQVSIEKQMR